MELPITILAKRIPSSTRILIMDLVTFMNTVPHRNMPINDTSIPF